YRSQQSRLFTAEFEAKTASGTIGPEVRTRNGPPRQVDVQKTAPGNCTIGNAERLPSQAVPRETPPPEELSQQWFWTAAGFLALLVMFALGLRDSNKSSPQRSDKTSVVATAYSPARDSALP